MNIVLLSGGSGNVCGRFPMTYVPNSLSSFLKHWIMDMNRWCRECIVRLNKSIRKQMLPSQLQKNRCRYDVKKVGLEEPVVVCPVDPYVEEALPYFYREFQRVAGQLKEYDMELILVNDGSQDDTLHVIKD